MIDGIIFDMDGTLVDMVDEITASWNISCINHGWKGGFSKQLLQSVMGLNGHDIGVILFPDIDEIEAEKRVQICSFEQLDYFKTHKGKTYIENEEYLINLSNKYPLFIVSNCLSGYIELFLDNYNYWKYFKDFANASMCPSKGKNIRYIADKYNLKNPIYVGDTIKDKMASDEANVEFIHASYGFGQVDCKNKITKLNDLLEV